MNIEKYDEDEDFAFSSGKVVFKISAHSPDGNSRDVGMVTTKEEYETKLQEHGYWSLLYAVDLPTRLAYLYNCLNQEIDCPQDEDFVFWRRNIGSIVWQKWFIVHRYNTSGDSLNLV